MFKQVATAFMIVCVSILVLALAIVPHHHHDGLPCFTIENLFNHNSDCDHHNNCDNDHSCCGHHHHESDAEDDNECVLDQLEFIATIDQKPVNICAVCQHSHDYYLLQAVLIGFTEDFSLPDEFKENRQIPYLVNYHSVFASRSLGLRAPPVA